MTGKKKKSAPSQKRAPSRAIKMRVSERVFTGGAIESVTVQGFKSLDNVNLTLSPVNVLVGANGAGKSNFLQFFDMLWWMTHGSRLQGYIAVNGGGNEMLFRGAKNTGSVWAHLIFRHHGGNKEYEFALRHTSAGKLVFSEESYRVHYGREEPSWLNLGAGHEESAIAGQIQDPMARDIWETLRGCVPYHFNDTSTESPLRLPSDVDDPVVLRSDGSNLPSVLLDLQMREERAYGEIVRLLRRIVPTFHEFDLAVLHDKVRLRWFQEDKKVSFGTNNTSDGTLRLMALITLLCMPSGRVPDVVLLDEPELGLHPYAITLLGALINRLGVNKQVIVATQSSVLVNEFKPEDIIVADMNKEGATCFNRPDKKELRHWLEDFRLGEIWEANVIGGNP